MFAAVVKGGSLKGYLKGDLGFSIFFTDDSAPIRFGPGWDSGPSWSADKRGRFDGEEKLKQTDVVFFYQ